MASKFLSAGVYTREQDFTVFASRIGLTRLGLVGKTMKGPAFEPIKIASTDEFSLRFGGTNSKLALPYVAQSFLSQSSELTVTRILGETGFENSGAWLIVAGQNSINAGSVLAVLRSKKNQITNEFYFNQETDVEIKLTEFYSGSTTFSGMTFEKSNVTTNDILSYNFNIIDDQILTEPWGIESITSNDINFYFNSLSGVTTEDFFIQLNNFPDFQNLNISSTWLSEPAIPLENTSFTLDLNVLMPVNPLTPFVISGSTGPLSTTNGFTVSLDETSVDYIVKKLSKNPEVVDGQTNLYVEKIYPHYIRQAVASNHITDLATQLVYTTEAAYTDYNNSYKNAITPWIVSRVIGGDVQNLFRVQTISDGDSANSEIKISIQNLDLTNYRFDLVVRGFYDTDATANSSALERYSNLSMNEDDVNFIGRVIGTTNEDFPRRSNFITIDLAPSYAKDSIPAGFRGYEVRNTGISGTTAPDIYYKTIYNPKDTVYKTYLGVSELGYGNFTPYNVSYKNSIKTLEKDLFEYNGGVATGMTTTRGFHLENVADYNYFISGDKNSLTAYTNDAGTLIDRSKLKFTLVPAGGFDGFDKYKTYENAYEEFTDAFVDNVNQFKKGIDTFANVEEVDINVFATPGIDFQHNLQIVQYALDMIEERFDALYVIDAPRLTNGVVKGTPEELVSILESTGINSSYACTYWPWIQYEDVNNSKYTWQPPTLMAVESFAYTDNVSNPWFAPAGINRGKANSYIVKADIKPNKNNRDTLYEGRINPIATYIQEGIIIWGQKTLQVNSSALDRINVRRLLLQVRRLIAAASKTLVFEQNDQTLKDQFLSRVEPILLNIKNQRGLSGFKVVMDESNNGNNSDRNTLVGKIQIKPTPTAEFIDLTFQVLPTGANFEDF